MDASLFRLKIPDEVDAAGTVGDEHASSIRFLGKKSRMHCQRVWSSAIPLHKQWLSVTLNSALLCFPGRVFFIEPTKSPELD